MNEHEAVTWRAVGGGLTFFGIFGFAIDARAWPVLVSLIILGASTALVPTINWEARKHAKRYDS